jgi:secondary thiamine-phosphate synthase enzyme
MVNKTVKEWSVYTDYVTIKTSKRYDILDITEEVQAVRSKARLFDGTILVSTMHITSSIFVNDHESGLWRDIQTWLEMLAPAKPDYHHHQTGEDNADAHLKRMVLGHQVIVPVTAGALDLGTWERVHYGEFDGLRPKRVLFKAMGMSEAKQGA